VTGPADLAACWAGAGRGGEISSIRGGEGGDGGVASSCGARALQLSAARGWAALRFPTSMASSTPSG
jgi:hypothetical protein